jgi:hypothetical protein
MSEKPQPTTLKLTYPTHLLEDGRTVCGEHLAAELVADALKLLVAVEGNNADAAWKKLWDLAAPVARQLDEKIKAGEFAGLVLQSNRTEEEKN